MSGVIEPCVWCGGKGKCNELRRGNYRRTGDNYQVVCNKCRARGPLIQDSRSEAISAWNQPPVRPTSRRGGEA